MTYYFNATIYELKFGENKRIKIVISSIFSKPRYAFLTVKNRDTEEVVLAIEVVLSI